MKFFYFLFFIVFMGIGDKNTIMVDILETNHVYDVKGTYIFTQIIAWKIMPEDGKPHNVGWRMVKENHDFPIKNGNIWYVIVDNKKIYAKMHTERWLNFDIERQDTNSYWHNHRPNVFDKYIEPIIIEEVIEEVIEEEK